MWSLFSYIHSCKSLILECHSVLLFQALKTASNMRPRAVYLDANLSVLGAWYMHSGIWLTKGLLSYVYCIQKDPSQWAGSWISKLNKYCITGYFSPSTFWLRSADFSVARWETLGMWCLFSALQSYRYLYFKGHSRMHSDERPHACEVCSAPSNLIDIFILKCIQECIAMRDLTHVTFVQRLPILSISSF